MTTIPKHWWFRVAAVCGVLALIVAAAFASYAFLPKAPPRTPLQFDLKAGSSLKSAAQQMSNAGLLDHPGLFVLMGRLLGEAGRVKAGSYEIASPISPFELLGKITRGDVTLDSVTFVEGWTFRQLRRTLDQNARLKHDSQDMSEKEIIERLNISSTSAEGWFFPDTYHFSSGTSDLSILRRAYQLMRTNLEGEWARRKPQLPLGDPYEALILASIVEKETGKAAERTMVAAVFVNRLRIGMRLQTDPTVIYGLGDAFDGNLRKRDLLNDTPYNTYTRTGLPPTPIAMPGIESIRAALNPAETDMLYFVARGDGSSHFSRSLGEHERAVTKYQRNGRR